MTTQSSNRPAQPEGTAPTNRGREALFRTLLVLGALGVVFILLEIGLRLGGLDLNANPRWQYHRTLGWTVSQSWHEVDQVNPLGFRFPEVPETKPPGRKRLVVLGDSFSLGSAYDYAQTFPGLLGTWLGEEWDVINLGVGGWGTAQQLIALREVGLKYDPDAILLQVYPFNDVCNNAPEMVFTCELMDVHRPYLRPDASGTLRPSPPAHLRRRTRLRRWSRLAGLLELRLAFGRFAVGRVASDPKEFQRWRWSRRKQGMAAAGLAGGRGSTHSLVPPAHQAPSVRAAWRTTEALLAGIAHETASRELPLMAVVIPTIETFPPTWDTVRAQEPATFVADHATATTEAILRRLDVPTVSLRAEINRRDDGMAPKDWYYPLHTDRDTHLNRFGLDRTARFALWQLRQAGLTDARPPAWPIDFDAVRPTTAPVAVRGLIRPKTEKRVSFGPEASLAFSSIGSVPVVLDFSIQRRADQEVWLAINGEEQARWSSDAPSHWSHQHRFDTVPGRNIVSVHLPDVPPSKAGAAVFSTLALRDARLPEPSP